MGLFSLNSLFLLSILMSPLTYSYFSIRSDVVIIEIDSFEGSKGFEVVAYHVWQRY